MSLKPTLQLDRDTDERLTKAEALDFLSKLFTLINTDDSDCKIDVDELLQLLDELEVPWDHQLAVKMLLDQVCEFFSELDLLDNAHCSLRS